MIEKSKSVLDMVSLNRSEIQPAFIGVQICTKTQIWAVTFGYNGLFGSLFLLDKLDLSPESRRRARKWSITNRFPRYIETKLSCDKHYIATCD